MTISSRAIDYQAPDYTPIIRSRLKKAQKLKEQKKNGDTALLEHLRLHYQHHPWEFISDWGVTFEPRNVERGLITKIPFVLCIYMLHLNLIDQIIMKLYYLL